MFFTMEISTLTGIDEYLLLSLNGSDSIFLDGCMTVYTSMAIWMPLALMLIYVLAKNNSTKDFMFLLLVVAAVVGLTDFISSGLCKPFFERWRPTRDPVLMYVVDVVNETRGGSYGFTSSHAANSFGIATFVILLIKNRALSVSLVVWASMNAFTRIYLGVHYPGDIIAGTLIGVSVGVLMYLLYSFIKKKQRKSTPRDWVSGEYTKSGYLMSDVYLLLVAMYATFALIPIISFFTFAV